MYDILIRNASVIDGTGRPAYGADVAVKDGKIVLNPEAGCPAAEVIDAAGLTLCPGFIDAHSHGDLVFGSEAGRLCKTSQGITTELTGQCGETFYPMSPDPEKQELLKKFVGQMSNGVPACASRFTSLERYLEYVQTLSLTCNFKIYTGHAALRIAAMGFENRKATPEELNHMKALLREAMEHGSMGLTSGLIYSPSCYADEDELVELCKVVAEYDGFYATHMRNEAVGVLESVRESIAIAERSGCRLDISHHKICGKENWGLSAQTLQMVHEAIARGVRITIDVYPYLASMTNLNVCLPSSFFVHGPEKMCRLLRDPAVRAELKPQIQQMDGRYRHCGGFSGILVASAPNTPECRGLTIEDYARRMGQDPFEAFFDILADNGHGALAIYFSMGDEDLKRIMADENAVVGTDGIVLNLTDPTHPRGFGSFPKAIRYFVREQKLLTLEQMIHKMTYLTAQRFLIPNKGAILDGYDADLLLIRADEISDRADFVNSLALSDGIERVIVGGATVYAGKQLTGAAPGKFLPHTH